MLVLVAVLLAVIILLAMDNVRMHMESNGQPQNNKPKSHPVERHLQADYSTPMDIAPPSLPQDLMITGPAPSPSPAPTPAPQLNPGNIDILDIADWFLHKEPMTHKKLQKICYYAVAWGWALMDRSIARHAAFHAWVHGPVSPVLYKKYKDSGWNALKQPNRSPAVPNDISELLESVWATYGDKEGNELEALSHIELPWRNARSGMAEDARSAKQISSADMRKYYRSIYKGDDK